MDDVKILRVDLARQRAHLQALKEERQQRGDDLTEVLGKLAELRQRIEKLGDGTDDGGVR